MPGERVERFEAPVVQDKELDAAERALKPGMATVATRERKTCKQLGDTLVQDGAVVTAGFVAERAGEPAFTDTGRAGDHQAVVLRDPVTRHELDEQCTVQAPITAVIDILGRRLVTKFGEAQAGSELAVVAEAPFAVQQQRQPFRVGQALSLGIAGQFGERPRHAVALVAAATIVAELGDISRFSKAEQLMSYLGLVPSEDSSGKRRRQGGITKAGNGAARRMLIEAAWSYRFPARISREQLLRQEQLAAPIRAIAWKAQERLCLQYRKLSRAGKPITTVTTAIARQLAGFVWAIAHEVSLPTA